MPVDETNAPIDLSLGMEDLMRRGHSYRNVRPAEVLVATERDGKRVMGEFWEFIESGRFEAVLEATHRFFAHLDEEEKEYFWTHNPDLMDWTSVWGYTKTRAPYRDDRPDIDRLNPYEVARFDE